MALKPTIYKAQVSLADSDRNCYEELSLTLARHPSETQERLTARLLAYCLNHASGLEFTRGISTADEPDIWRQDDTGEIAQWIEIGQPEEPRLRKACGRARQVDVYAFGKSAHTWWKLNGPTITNLPRLSVWQFDWQAIVDASALIDRNSQLNLSIVGGTLYLDNGDTSVSLEPLLLHSPD